MMPKVTNIHEFIMSSSLTKHNNLSDMIIIFLMTAKVTHRNDLLPDLVETIPLIIGQVRSTPLGIDNVKFNLQVLI